MDRTTELAEIERLKVLMAHYSTWGDTQQWDKFATLLHEDAEFIIDAAPRATPDADPVIKINGRDNYVNGMIDYTNGFHTAHQMYLPDITIIDEDTAHATWCLHDYVKTPVVNFKGWGHMHDDYVKVDGGWKIRKLHTTRTLVEEEWL